MSEPVAWLIPGCITRDKELAEVNKAYAEPLYLNPDPRIAELEAVLRECREVLVHCAGVFDEVRGYPITYDLTIEAITKIYEVLK